MKRRMFCGGVLASFLLLSSVVVYAEMIKDIQAHKDCRYCGMDREKFAHSRMLIEYSDGSSVGLCSIHCAAIDLAQAFDKQPEAILVADYNKKNLINAETAYWVIGGKIPGVMTKTGKWAFADKEEALAFIKANGGKLANFEDAMQDAYEDMYNDTKMIRQKRAKMKAMKEQTKQ